MLSTNYGLNYSKFSIYLKPRILPEIKKLNIDLSKYDTVFLTSPFIADLF